MMDRGAAGANPFTPLPTLSVWLSGFLARLSRQRLKGVQKSLLCSSIPESHSQSRSSAHRKNIEFNSENSATASVALNARKDDDDEVAEKNITI